LKVTALGHAGLQIETTRAKLLLDPWFSPEGAFQGSWFQFPDNAHLLKPSLFEPTAIAIKEADPDWDGFSFKRGDEYRQEYAATTSRPCSPATPSPQSPVGAVPRLLSETSVDEPVFQPEDRDAHWLRHHRSRRVRWALDFKPDSAGVKCGRG
jgi:hypothetical protein